MLGTVFRGGQRPLGADGEAAHDAVRGAWRNILGTRDGRTGRQRSPAALSPATLTPATRSPVARTVAVAAVPLWCLVVAPPLPAADDGAAASRYAGPWSAEAIMRRYDLDGDGTVDEVEAAIAQSKLRRQRQETRRAREIDPLTGRPRGEADQAVPPDPRDGLRERITGVPGDDPPAADGVPPVVDGVSPRRGAAGATGRSDDARRARIESVLPSRGRSGGGTATGGADPSGTGRPGVTDGGRPEAFGWVPGGNGTVFRGGSYPLPPRGSARAGGGMRGGIANPGTGPLLGGRRGSADQGAGNRQGPNAWSPSRATVPPSSRGSGARPSGSSGQSSSGRPSGR